jgi:hydrogenase maturation protease
MSRALVLGCGNSQRGDDSVALRIVEILLRGKFHPDVEILSQQQWMPELAEPISNAQMVIFVDAADGVPPGTIACKRLQPEQHNVRSITHHTSPESLLWLAGDLYGKHPPHAYLLTIGGASFDLGEELSEPVRKAIPHAVKRIMAMLSGEPLPGS